MSKKSMILGLSLFAFLTVAIFASCGGNDMCLKKPLDNFSKLIDGGDFNDFTLTIYYMSPFILTRAPLSVDDLVYGITAVNETPREKDDKNGLYEQKIIIEGSRLEEHIDLLNQIKNATLIPEEKKSYVNARIYYLFETKKDGRIFDVVLWGGYDENSIFVNEVEVKENDIFYDVLRAFLPEDAVNNLNNYIAGVWP